MFSNRLAIAISGTLFAIGFACLTQAQVSMTGAGKGAPGSAAYTGPGDLQTFGVWGGLRCYNAAYTGNVADVYAPADATHTLITCSAGGIINETLQLLATTCLVSCTVKTLYDQTGGGNNFTDLTFSVLRPTYITSCNGALPCLRFTSSLYLTTSYTQAQALSTSWVANHTSDVANETVIGSSNFYSGFTSSNLTLFYANGGGAISVSATQNVWHAANAVFNGASSTANVDGSTGSDSIGTAGVSSPWVGKSDIDFSEAGVMSGSFSAGNMTALCHNQRLYWSTTGSC